MKIITTEKKPIKSWTDNLEDNALSQAKNLANLPFIFKHVALMPDCHSGYGMPIGGVLATKGMIIPNAVGVDIGCGMCAVKLHIKEISKENLQKIVDLAKTKIPVGFNWHDEPQLKVYMPVCGTLPVVGQNYVKATKQIGTLGGGNHFIEIQKGSDDYIWIMIHSGSRNLGHTVANHYNKVAIKLNDQYYSSVEKNKELAFLPIESKEAKLYMEEMKYCVDFALANRQLMMNRMIKCFIDILGEISSDTMINESHNFAAWENHFNTNVIVHRKGATRAYEGELGMIPGSQGTNSYIVRGLGNPESFKSCSHGAGRAMGRKQATKDLDLKEQLSILNKQNIIHDITCVADLDEAPGAYKDIHTVIEEQKDLMEVVVTLSPLAVIKG